MEMIAFQRRLTTLLSADVSGYGRLMGDDEEETLRTLKAYRATMIALIRQNRGRVVDAPGDNLLAEFPSVVETVHSAMLIQKGFCAQNAELPAGRRMQFRIGINIGDVIEDGDQIYGDDVNIAARMEALAEPGGVCISGRVYALIENKLALEYEYIGKKQVKNNRKPIPVFRVHAHSDTVAKGSNTAQKAVKKKLKRAARVVTNFLLICLLALFRWP